MAVAELLSSILFSLRSCPETWTLPLYGSLTKSQYTTLRMLLGYSSGSCCISPDLVYSQFGFSPNFYAVSLLTQSSLALMFSLSLGLVSGGSLVFGLSLSLVLVLTILVLVHSHFGSRFVLCLN